MALSEGTSILGRPPREQITVRERRNRGKKGVEWIKREATHTHQRASGCFFREHVALFVLIYTEHWRTWLACAKHRERSGEALWLAAPHGTWCIRA